MHPSRSLVFSPRSRETDTVTASATSSNLDRIRAQTDVLLKSYPSFSSMDSGRLSAADLAEMRTRNEALLQSLSSPQSQELHMQGNSTPIDSIPTQDVKAGHLTSPDRISSLMMDPPTSSSFSAHVDVNALDASLKPQVFTPRRSSKVKSLSSTSLTEMLNRADNLLQSSPFSTKPLNRTAHYNSVSKKPLSASLASIEGLDDAAKRFIHPIKTKATSSSILKLVETFKSEDAEREVVMKKLIKVVNSLQKKSFLLQKDSASKKLEIHLAHRQLSVEKNQSQERIDCLQNELNRCFHRIHFFKMQQVLKEFTDFETKPVERVNLVQDRLLNYFKRKVSKLEKELEQYRLFEQVEQKATEVEISLLKEELSSKTEQLEVAWSESKHRFEMVQNLERDLAQMTSAHDTLISRISNLESQLSESNSEVRHLKEFHESEKASWERALKHRDMAEEAQRSAALKEINHELHHHRLMLAQAEGKAESQASHIERLQATKIELEEKLGEEQRVVSLLRQEKRQLLDQLEKEYSLIDKLEKQVADVSARHEQAMVESPDKEEEAAESLPNPPVSVETEEPQPMVSSNDNKSSYEIEKYREKNRKLKREVKNHREMLKTTKDMLWQIFTLYKAIETSESATVQNLKEREHFKAFFSIMNSFGSLSQGPETTTTL